MKEYEGITIGIYRNLTVKAFCEMCVLEKEFHANPDNCANLLLFKRKILGQLHAYREVSELTVNYQFIGFGDTNTSSLFLLLPAIAF